MGSEMCIRDSHGPAADLRQLALEASLVEAGNSVSLEEAKRMAASNAHLPNDANEASQKLEAFSVAVDVFFGTNHRLSVAIRSAVGGMRGPLSRIRSSQAQTSAQEQDLACRVMFEIQQDVFSWIREVNSKSALAEANAVEAPVSYTHLRAHETPEHLVCRLLL